MKRKNKIEVLTKAKKHGVANNKNAEKKISESAVRKLAIKHWTNSEIAAFFDCSEKTIYNRFTEVIAKGKEEGKAKLRDIQMKSAMNGNVTMQIWLGKQYLDQVDKTNVNGLSDDELDRLRRIASNEMANSL